MNSKTVLITGCSSGFGKQSAKLFQSKGWNVVATMRSPEKEADLGELENTLLCRLDVTDPQSIKEVVDKSLDAFGRIDVLVNNAGISGVGVFEQWDEGSIHGLFDTNVFGLMRVTKAVLPVMRRQREGTIINISSLAALIAFPFASVYSSAKFAVEGLTEALALEYAPFNISVKAIAPGSYETSLYTSMDEGILANGDDQIRAYSAKLATKMNDAVTQMARQGGEPSDPREVAEKVYECATEDRPIHNVCGRDAESFLQMKKSLSEQEMSQFISDQVVPKDV